MTDKPTPTDAELKALWRIHAADIGGSIYYARAVLAKWGTPAVAEEPFCWHWENTFDGGMGAWKKNPETLGINMSHPEYKWTALYTTPQPTQAQAGAVPLTDEQCDAIYEALDSFGHEVDHYEFGLPYRASDGETLAKTEAREVIRQAAHGIKGGQHGTE